VQVIVGGNQVGKRTFVNRAYRNIYDNEEYCGSDKFIKIIHIPQLKCVVYLYFLDIRIGSNLKNFLHNISAFKAMYIRMAASIILLYAVNDYLSFEKVTELYEEVLEIKDADTIPAVLVG
jgi:GTPase SAR1 family protein